MRGLWSLMIPVVGTFHHETFGGVLGMAADFAFYYERNWGVSRYRLRKVGPRAYRLEMVTDGTVG